MSETVNRAMKIALPLLIAAVAYKFIQAQVFWLIGFSMAIALWMHPKRGYLLVNLLERVQSLFVWAFLCFFAIVSVAILLTMINQQFGEPAAINTSIGLLMASVLVAVVRSQRKKIASTPVPRFRWAKPASEVSESTR